MRFFECLLLTQKIPVTLNYLLFSTETSFKCCILLCLGSVLGRLDPQSLHLHGIELPLHPWKDGYPSQWHAPLLSPPRQTHPLYSPGVLPGNLDARLFEESCSHFFFSWQMPSLLALSVSVGEPGFKISLHGFRGRSSSRSGVSARVSQTLDALETQRNGDANFWSRGEGGCSEAMTAMAGVCLYKVNWALLLVWHSGLGVCM